MKQIPLTQQERAIIEEAFQPYIQAVTIIARMRGLNPAMIQISNDRSCFIIPEEVAPKEIKEVEITRNGS